MNWKELYALVNENIKNAVSGLYKPAGDVTFAELPELSQSVLGYTYTVTDAFTTDSRFTDYNTETQTGHSFPADTEVAVIVTGTTENPVYMFNVMGGIMDGYATKGDLDNYVEKEAGKSLSTNDYTDADKALVQDSPITVTRTGAEITASTAQGKPNKVTIYGKSEVVDGAIVSAGDSGTITITTADAGNNNSTAAILTTGTPLRGIPEGAKDVAEWDGSTGEVTSNCSEVDLGSLTWTYDAPNNRFYTNLMDTIYTTPRTLKMLCANYECISDGRPFSQVPNLSIYNGYYSTDIPRIYIHDNAYTDAVTFTAAIQGVKLVYPLETTVTTPFITTENNSFAGLETYAPQTHITNNAGADMTIEAYAGTANGQAVNELKQDVQSKIAAQTAAQLALIAVPYDSTATYNAGDFVTEGGKLYKCSTPVSTAEPFDPTKWTATTVMAEITV